MNFYILDDDINIIKKLEFIIESEGLGYVIGYACDSEKGLEEIRQLKPGIVLIDLLMPKKNGITVVDALKKEFDFSFIMISQVSNQEMIAEAYHAGIEFFISKPIIKAEVLKVIETVKSKIIFKKALTAANAYASPNKIGKRKYKSKKILNAIGIASEKGSHDLIKIIDLIIREELENDEICLKEVAKQLNLSYTTSMQRIRRAITKGLENIAAEGVEDLYSFNVTEYGNKLYGFCEVRQTMQYLQGKSKKPGKTNISQFIESLLILNNDY